MKKTMKKILIAVISLAMIACFVPQTGTQVYAEDGDPAMVVGAESVLKSTANTDNAQTVWYAGNAWRVISYNGSGNEYTKPTGAMTLFSSGLLATGKQFNQDYQAQTANDYANSDLQNTVNGLYSSLFSEKEKKAVIERTLSVDEYSGTSPYTTGVSGTATSGYLWPLSTAEALVLPSNTFRSADAYWWLRSPGLYVYNAALVASGMVSRDGGRVDDANSVRPAFDLNLKSVLFTSAAVGGKSDTEGTLTAVGKNTTGEWKLTLKDDGSENAVGNGHAGFTVDTAQIVFNSEEKTATVPYSGAATTANDYISAIITDAQDANIKYYGKIAKASAEGNPSVTVSIADMEAGDHLYIFNEQCNGDKQTDFASALTEVTVPALITYTVTFKVKNGSWNDGTKADKQVTLSRFDNQDLALVLKAEDIPAVGSKPANGYKAGSWDTTPDTETQVTKDMTYTYSYLKSADSTPTPATVSGTLLAKMTAKGSKNLVLSWNKINGAAGYDVFFVKCKNNSTCKLVKTIEGNKTLTWTKKSLKKKTAYKAFVKAWVMKDGKKSYVRTSPTVHAYTSGSTKNYTNPKSVTVSTTSVSLAAGKTFTVKAKVNKIKKGKKLMPTGHAPKLRYLSSNTKVAAVNGAGKITAKAKGTCKVYVYAVNGVSKTVKVTVK